MHHKRRLLLQQAPRGIRGGGVADIDISRLQSVAGQYANTLKDWVDNMISLENMISLHEMDERLCKLENMDIELVQQQQEQEQQQQNSVEKPMGIHKFIAT